MRILLVPFVLVALLGCPPAGNKGEPAQGKPACAQIGQSCEVSPGKLGTCVKRDECASGDCFVCQSQH